MKSLTKFAAVRALTVLAGAAGLMLAMAADAGAVSDKVKSACKNDYYKFCPQYSVGSTALRQCMRSAGKNISLVCRRALVAEGELPAKYAR